MTLDAVETEAVRAAAQAGRDAAVAVAPGTYPGIVTEVDPQNAVAMVQPDGPVGMGGSHGADIVAPISLQPGDRVMILYAPPHGAMVIGRHRGDFDDWHVVGDPGEPVFVTGWTHDTGVGQIGQAATYAPVSFTRRGGRVELRGHGRRTSGSSQDIFTLPQQYRPENNLICRGSATVLAAAVPIIITTAGMVSSATNQTPIWLDGISFLAATVNPT